MSQLFREAPTLQGAAPTFWEPVVVRDAEIKAEAERLASGAAASDGSRESLIVHPCSSEPGLGLAPGIQVRLSVLAPGERTAPRRHNATEVSFCIAGSGRARVGPRTIDFRRYDVWNHPSWTSYSLENDGSELQVRLTYSNAALLQKLQVHRVDDDAPEPGSDGRGVPVPEAGRKAADDNPEMDFSPFPFGEDGAQLMPYETLISPPTVASPVLHWSWEGVKERLDRLMSLGESYAGRRLYLLYNPMTGRTNGTTPSFFSTLTMRPPGIVDRPHRHVSAAINYYFHGAGYSRVAGRRYEWEAGDLMLSAPGWAVHHHASHPGEPVYELTIQDQPLHIAMESLLWQEDLQHPASLLGVDPGFRTNRSDLGDERRRA